MQMTQDRVVRASIGISVAVHLVLFCIALFWRLPGMPDVMENTKKMFHISKTELNTHTPPPRREVIQSYVRSLKFQSPLQAPVVSDTPKAGVPEKVDAPDIGHAPEKIETRLSQPEKLMFKEDPGASKEKVDVIRRKPSPDAKLIGGLSDPSGKEIVDPGNGTEIEVPEPFTEKMFAFTPASVTAQAPIAGAFTEIWRQGDNEDGGKYGSLDRYMNFRISTWRDPQDGQGYFELAILPGHDASRLPAMAKEIVFLVDASLSIRENRIQEFTKGISYALKNLNKNDRFNIITFKDDVTHFSDRSVVPDASELGPALRFLRQLEPSKSTDIGRVMDQSVRAKPSMLPSYVVLMSDGRPTQGVISSAKVIEEISRINNQQRSVFALTGGRRVNRYLLDFLTYQNRGWSEYAQNTNDIPRRISEFYDKIRDPLLMNLRFQFSRIDETEVYPKHLPDFFRNAELVVYGLYNEESEFSIRLLGDVGDSTKEVIFTGDIKKAKAGTRDIAAAWAFNKIYYLISRMTLEGRSSQLENQIHELSVKFNITTPYNLEDQTD